MSTVGSRQTDHRVPEAVAPIAELMSGFGAPWALCGGWAVDAWLGRLTREHQDVDIIAFVQDHQALFEHLSAWELVAHDRDTSDTTTERWDGRPLTPAAHIHGRIDTGAPLPAGGILMPTDGFVLDIQLNERAGDDWVLSQDPRLTVPLAVAVAESPWGLPAVVPEVLLFYKALELRRRDKADFAAVHPHLTAAQRDWLRGAIELVGHPWLAELSR